MNRPDKVWNKLSVTEKEVGGIPNSSEDIKQAHAAAIEMYINDHVGHMGDGVYGNIYFNETLNDWARFDINKRTKFDAAISSGLAIMACNKNRYKPNAERVKQKLNITLNKYENKGTLSKGSVSRTCVLAPIATTRRSSAMPSPSKAPSDATVWPIDKLYFT